MHTTLTIGITTGTYNALRTVMVDPQEWIENAVKHRAHTATVDIVRDYTVYKTTKNQPIVAVGSTAVPTPIVTVLLVVAVIGVDIPAIGSLTRG